MRKSTMVIFLFLGLILLFSACSETDEETWGGDMDKSKGSILESTMNLDPEVGS